MSLEETNVVALPVRFKPHPVEAARPPLKEFGKLARAHGDAFEKALDGSDGLKRMFVDESLRLELANQVTGIAEQVELLASKARTYGELATCANLKTLAGDLEYVAGLLHPITEPT